MTEAATLLKLANSGPAGEVGLAELPRYEYAYARSLARMSRLKQILAKEGVNEEKQAERRISYNIERAKVIAFMMGVEGKPPSVVEAALKELDLDLVKKEGSN